MRLSSVSVNRIPIHETWVDLSPFFNDSLNPRAAAVVSTIDRTRFRVRMCLAKTKAHHQGIPSVDLGARQEVTFVAGRALLRYATKKEAPS